MTDTVLIVLRRDDVAELAEGFQRFADEVGIAIMRCEADGLDVGSNDCRYVAVETPGPLPRPYDLHAPEITHDMAETIRSYYDSFQSAGELSIESNARGLWFLLPWGQRLFIGLARLHGELPEIGASQSDTQPDQSARQSCAVLRPR